LVGITATSLRNDASTLANTMFVSDIPVCTTPLRRREAASKIAEANKKAAASLKVQKELEDRIKTAEAKGEKRLQALREKMQSVSTHMHITFITCSTSNAT
jgi:hypothetical protein